MFPGCLGCSSSACSFVLSAIVVIFFLSFRLVLAAVQHVVTRNHQCVTHTYLTFSFQSKCFIPKNMICSWYRHSRLNMPYHIRNTWWRHQMETFSALLAICAGNSPVPGEFPTQRQWRGALMFSLICVWINSWVNNRDLRHYRAHYDVSVKRPDGPDGCVRCVPLGSGMSSLTLSQWSSSGNPVTIQCAWNLDASVHWNATGEKMLVASVLPMVFQWSSSGFPVVFQCVPIMQINTGSPLEHHWVLASASVVQVASQCTCGSSGLPVRSNYAN